MTTVSRTRLKGAIRGAFLGGVSTLALCAMAGQTMAQDAPAAAPAADDGTVVVVTGIRGSLQRSMNIKKNSSGVVDAITAEDIGKYPDTNLAESIQRIPGVSISRVNGEGSAVTVRGFGPGFNLVTLNGRVMPTANIDAVGTDNQGAGGGSRNFDFANIASDGVSGFEVYKTGKGSIQSGGIGATLNIKTLRPIAKSGQSGSFTVKALHGENMVEGKDFTPEVSGAYQWTNDAKTFGLAVFGDYKEADVATRQATQNSWNLDYYGTGFLPKSAGRVRYNPDNSVATVFSGDQPAAGDLVTYANDSRYAFSEVHTKRANLMGTVQWRPTEDLLLTADALYIDTEATEGRSEQTNWFNRPFDQVTFVKGASGIFTAVKMQENENGSKDIGFEQQQVATKKTIESLGLNAVWDLSDNMKVTLDYQHAKGEALPNNPNGTTSTLFSMGAPVVTQHSVDFTGDIPVQAYTVNDGLPVFKTDSTGKLADAGGNAIVDANGNFLPGKSAADKVVIGHRGNNNGKLDAGDVGSQVARENVNSQSNTVDEFQAAMTYDFEGESKATFGVDLIKSEMTTTTGSTYQALGDWGIGKPGDIEQYAPGLLHTYDLGSLFQDFSPGQSNIAFRGNAIDLYNAVAKGYGATIPTASITANTIKEDIKALYGEFSMKGDLLGMPAHVSAGIRYEKTDVDASALQSIPVALRWTADNDFTTDFGTGVNTIKMQASYDNWLPNLDVSVNVRDDLVVRGSFSKTIARPSYGQMYATTTVNTPPRPTLNGVNPTAASGNPGLLPLESSNIDLSVEWYYGKSDYVSIGFYNKDVANFIGTGRIQTHQFDLRDPTSGATGSRSGIAKDLLGTINQSTTDVNLFTMTALYDHYLKLGNNSATAQTKAKSDYQSHQDGSGNLDQTYVDQVLKDYDLVADANDPLFTFEQSIPVNNKTANLHGIEIQGQHFFGDSGFGLAGSLTTVDGDIAFDNSAPPGTQQFPLLGLSDTYNVTAIYDKGGALTARASYNYRAEYITSAARDGAAGNPTYTEPFGVLDAAVNYQITPSILLTFEGLNLTKEHLRQHGRDKVDIYFAQELDSRYQVGMRYKF